MPQVVAAVAAAITNFIFGLFNAAGVVLGAKTAMAVYAAIEAGVYAFVSYGLSLAGSLLRPKPRIPKAEDGRVGVRQPTASRQSGYGRARIAGVYMLYEERAGHSFDVLAFHDGEIDEVERYFLNDDEVTVIGGTVQPTAEGAYGGGRVRFYTNEGPTPNVAFSEITGNLPDIYTAQHRGDGVAQTGLVCQSVAQQDIARIYPNGLPTPSVVARLQKVFDPRDPTQSFANRASWKWSDNPILCLMHFLTDTGAGMAFNYERRILPALSYWIEAANVCDEAVALKAGGTEKRYRCGGWFLHDTDPIEIVDMLLTTCDGWMAQRGDGALVVRAGKYYDPTVTFTTGEIIEFSTQRYVPDEDAINELVVGYTSPINYTDVEAPAWIDEEDKAARNKDRVHNVEVGWCQSRAQARRLAKRQVIRSNAPARGWIRVNLFGRAALGERYIRIQNDAIPSLADIVVEVQKIEFDIVSMTMTITYVQVGAEIDAWNAATEEGEPESIPDTPGGVLPPTPTGVAGNGLYVVIGADQIGVAFRVEIDEPARSDLNFAIGWGVRGTYFGEEVTFTRDQAKELPGGKLQFIISRSSIVPGRFYIVRAATIAPGGTYSNWREAEFPLTGALNPPPPLAVTATGGAGQAVLGWRNPTGPHAATLIYRADDGDTFDDATLVATVTGSAGATQSHTVTGLAAGTHQFWFRTRSTTPQDSQVEAGPLDAIVT